MNKKFKFLTVLLALVMTLGAFAPFGAVKAADETTETVTLHKILQTKENLNAKKEGKDVFPGTKGLDDTEYDGNLIGKKEDNTQTPEDIKNALIGYFGVGSTEIAGVYFAFKYNDGTNSGKYVTIKEEAGKDPVYGAVESLDATADQLGAGFKLLAGKTLADGIKFTTKGLKGKFLIEEIHDKSTYKNDDGSVITDNKAVPVDITLPLVNNDGVVVNVHVYPKNTEEKPKIDKNFSVKEAKKYMTTKEAEKLDAAIEHKVAFDKVKKAYAETTDEYKNAEKAYTTEDRELIAKWGIDLDNNQRKKQTLDKKIGDDVEYTVVTEIPAKSKLAEAHWDDKMTEGLTYNKDLKVTIGGTEITPSTDELVQTDNGFSLRLKGDNLALLNNKDAAVTVVLTYTAKINNTTVTDVEESNDVTFHYGNTPGKGNTPVPNKPKDGKITVTKTMKDGQEWPAKGIQVQLVNANTGENVGEAVTLTSSKTTHTWEKLDAETEYKVVELTTGYDVVYGKGADNALGQISIDNYKTSNPPPLNPSEPKVITGGKKFVKTNQDGTERLAGAEFYVKNSEGKYLALKSGTTTKAEVTAYENAEKAYNDFIKAYNEKVAEVEKYNKEKKAEDPAKKVFPWSYGDPSAEYKNEIEINNKLKELKDTRDKAFKAARENYQWVEAAEKDKALVLTSDDQGRFEITGLAYGTYYLEEKEAPKDYAKLNGLVKFEVKKGSYTNEEEGKIDYEKIDYNEKSGKNDAQQVKNKKVSIPQTGGIGTVIFTVVGVMLMVGAAFALKRRKEDELEGLA